MRVKVNGEWYAATPEQPIMVELTPADKLNISRMFPEAKRYAEFSDESTSTREERLAWMTSDMEVTPNDN